MIEVRVDDRAVQDALKALAERCGNVGPVLRAIGEDVVEDAKRRFETSTGPDGKRWAPNARATIEAYIAARGGFGKRGINKRGIAAAMAKKPLIGHSGDLRRQIFARVTGNTLTVGVSPKYAAIQQFGGRAGRGLKVTIPARPFLPVTARGELYAGDRDRIVATLSRHLAAAR